MALASLDRRTRYDVDLRAITVDDFLTDVFPDLAERHGALVARGIAALDAPPLTVEVGDRSLSFTSDGSTVVAQEGPVDGAVVVVLDEATFSDWAQLQVSFNGLAVAMRLEFRDGTIRDVSVWDSLWMTLLEGWTVVADDLTFVDRHGEPLDLGRSFGPDDDPEDIAHFLREAGYLHLRGWMDVELMATIADDIDRAVPHYTEDDGRSWWAILKDGTKRVVRLQEFLGHSPAAESMLEGERWEQLRRTIQGDDELVFSKSIEALIKPVGVEKGASDVTFHRDCHMGRHPYGCSGTTVGISVTASSEANGRLRVAAGSHRVAMPVVIAQTEPYLPVVAVTTEPGDLTVHLGCTLHEAQPPVSEPRKVMYAGFGLAPREGDLPEGSAALKEIRETQHKMLLADDAPSAAEAWETAAP